MKNKPYHIYKKDGYWHVSDRVENVTFHFYSYESALYAARKGIDSVKNFRVPFNRKGS